jgi:pimeloyl-ACP methyl ester carboxylesterase
MKRALIALVAGATLLAAAAQSQPTPAVTRTDHIVAVKSTAPGMYGQVARLYVREVTAPGSGGRGVVLFVHGAGTPAEVSFDAPYADYSWMAYLARAGFDVFAVDMTGYGRSTRPPPMDDTCNASAENQAELIPAKLAAACPPTFHGPITTMGSDWADIGAAVDYILDLRHAKTLALVGWSQGGPRTAGYALAHPDKVRSLVVLAPAYNPDMPTRAPDPLTIPPGAAPMSLQSLADFKANWDRQAPCPGQYEPEASASVWGEMLKSDPVGARWGPGVRRAPTVPSWGFNAETAPKLTVPFLMISGENDKQVAPERVRQLYAAVGSQKKVFIDLACSSHNAMWEKNHRLLFKASADWLTTGAVEGQSQGMLRLGY